MKRPIMPLTVLFLTLVGVTFALAGELDQFTHLPAIFGPVHTPTTQPTPTASATPQPSLTPTATSTSLPTATPTSTSTMQPTAPAPTATATATTSAPSGCSICSYDAYNCGDFSTQSQAQACHDYCWGIVGYDVHNLDADGDGEACESLP